MIKMDYILHKDQKKKKIISVIKMEIPYIIEPKLKNRKNMLEIKEILIVNDEIKNNICKIQFNRLFRRLTKIILEVINSGDNEGDAIIALNEILHAKKMILDKYHNTLSKEEIKIMLKKLEYLEEEIKRYFINVNYLNKNEKSKGR